MPFQSGPQQNIRSINDFSVLLSQLHRLRFLRIILLKQDQGTYKQVSELIKEIEQVQNFSICTKGIIQIKELQKPQTTEVSFSKIEKIMAPLFARKGTELSERVIRQLTKVDKDLFSQLSLRNKSEGLFEHLYKIKQWRCIKLQCERPTEHISCLKAIRLIYFSYLKTLKLNQCSIDSIQSIAALQAPLLEQINLQRNHITQLRSLIKMSSNSVRLLNLEYNKIQEYDHLKQNHWLGLKEIELGTYKYFNFVQSITFVTKLSQKDWEFTISWLPSKRIMASRVKKMLMRKRVIVNYW